MKGLDGNGIEEGEFKTFEMDLIIPSMYSSSLENIEKFMNVDVPNFLQSSRDFVVQGEMLKLFLVLQPPQGAAKDKTSKGVKDELAAQTQPSIGYHVDVRLRNPDDFAKTSATPSSTKVVSKSVMVSNPKHGYVRHTPKLNSEYDTETANQMMESDTAYSSGSEATATSTTASTLTSSTSISKDGASAVAEDAPKGPLSDFVVINSPAGSTKAKNGAKPNFFRLPDGTIIFPIEIPVGVKSKYNNKDISVVVSVARVMQAPTGNAPGRLLNENLHLPFPGAATMAHHHVTSATKLEKLLSTQYPQYWQYSQYSRGGVGNILPPPSFAPSDPRTASIHGSHSNPNLVGLTSALSSSSLTGTGSSSLSRLPSSHERSGSSTSASLAPPSSHLSVSPLSNANSRSDPNIASLASSEDTLSPLPPSTSALSSSSSSSSTLSSSSLTSLPSSSSTLLPPTTTGMTSRGSSGNLYGMGQLQTSTSSATLNLANIANATGGQTGSTSANLSANLGVSSGAPVAIKTAQKIVRVLEPLQVRLLQLYPPTALKIGTKRLIPVAVSNTHPTLPITVRGLQLVLSNIPSIEGGANLSTGPGPDIHYNHISVTDKYKTSTLDIETFPVVVLPGDEYNFVVSVEPHTPPPTTPSKSPPPPPTASSRAIGISSKRRVTYTLQAQLIITWSIPCSPGSILSIHPLPVAFPAPHDLLVSFDSKSPVRAHNIFNVCFTITNLSNYSRDLTFIIPRPICVTGTPANAPALPSARSLPRSPPARASTLPSIKYTPSPSSPPSFASPMPPPRTPSAHNVASAHNAASPQSITASTSSSSPSLSASGPLPALPRPAAQTEQPFDEEEFLVRFGELQSNSASMLCLEKTLYVGLVKSNSSVSVNVRYVPLREGLFEIQGLQIFDRANDQMYVVQDTCQLYVIA